MIPFPINEETSDKFPINDGTITATEKITEKTTEKTTEKIFSIINSDLHVT